MVNSKRIWPVDGHVHFHELDLVAPMLDAAAANFRAIGGDSPRLLGALLLAQARTEAVFELLEGESIAGDWKLGSLQEEPGTLIAQRGEAMIAIVCGRQVRADDGLEVLALGTRATFRDGLPLMQAIEAVRKSGALIVIPWGVGKWLGTRGSRVDAALRTLGVNHLFVGDNGGRVEVLGVPPSVSRFERQGFRVLPGTDPFPFQRDVRRVGAFGFLTDLHPSQTAPWRQLRDWLASRNKSPQAYGRALGPIQFLANQIGLRLRNRLGHRASVPQ